MIAINFTVNLNSYLLHKACGIHIGQAVTEKAVELEAKYREIETELQNALEASHASKVDHAEATIAERKVRLQAIDSLREQLNALTQVSAHSRKR